MFDCFFLHVSHYYPEEDISQNINNSYVAFENLYLIVVACQPSSFHLELVIVVS